MALILYTKRQCRWCDEVREFLNERGVPFEERQVLGNKIYFEELVAKSGQTLTPTLDLDGEVLADTDKEAVELWLKGKGIIR